MSDNLKHMKTFEQQTSELNISDVMNSILNELYTKLDEHTSELSPLVCYEDSFYIKREALEEAYKDAINTVKKYYS